VLAALAAHLRHRVGARTDAGGGQPAPRRRHVGALRAHERVRADRLSGQRGGKRGGAAAALRGGETGREAEDEQEHGSDRAAHPTGASASPPGLPLYALKLQSLLPMKFSGVALAIATACAGTAATPRPSTSA